MLIVAKPSLWRSRGRNACYQAPPAQSRTCSFPASGSSVVLAFVRAIALCVHHMAPFGLRDSRPGNAQPDDGATKYVPCEAVAFASASV